MNLVEQFIADNWPLASVIFRPMMSYEMRPFGIIKICTMNKQIVLQLFCWGQWVFHTPGANYHDTYPLDHLLETEVGEELTQLEQEIYEYILAGDTTPTYSVVALMSDLPNFRTCFNIEYVRGTTVRISSRFETKLRQSGGFHKWSVLRNVVENRKEFLAAERLIARLRAYLTALRLIRELPQPIAEEIEEQFRPFKK